MKIGILTGGGDCPGLNQAIRGIVYKSLEYNDEIYGITDGYKGLIQGSAKLLKLEDVEELASRGGTILGTSRTNPFKKEEDSKKAVENFRNFKFEGLIAIGGEDTLGAANKLYEKGLPVVGVPKTMDNDLSAIDYSFGFDTSVTVAIDALNRLRDTARSHHRILILEVMGRHAGWVALFTGIAGGADWTFIPENVSDLDKVSAHLKKVFERRHYALVVVSEGVEFPESEKHVKGVREDDFGHVVLRERGVGEVLAEEIKNRTNIETRVAVIGHIQRGGPPTLFDSILAHRVGVKALEMIHNKDFGKMACLKDNAIKSISLKEAVSKLKTVDAEWWNFAQIFFK